MSSFHCANRAIETICTRVTKACGKAVAWLTVVMAVSVTIIVVLRATLDVGAIAAQEAVTYMHALVIMLACAYTLQEGGHVRVDIFYQRFSPLQKAWINVFGTLLLLIPVASFIVLSSWQYVCASWSIGETSADAGGLPAVFLLKTLIIGNGVLLIIQSLAELTRDLNALTFVSDHD